MHIKMHVRTYKLAKFFRGCISTCPDSTGTERERGKGRGRKKERRGKGKVEGMTEGRGRKDGEFGWGDCATAPRGDRRHCLSCSTLDYRDRFGSSKSNCLDVHL